MTKITQADIKCWKAIFSFTDEQMDIDNDDKRGLELLAAHREAAFVAGRDQAEREVADHARKAAQIHHRIAAETPRDDEMRVHSLSLSRAYGAVADAIENKEHRNDTD